MPWKIAVNKDVVRKEEDNKDREKLIALAKDGNEKAFNAYMKLNAPLMMKMVRSYHKKVSWVEIGELQQEARIGLLRGIRHYDPSKRKIGKPESYIFSWVRAALSRYIKVQIRNRNRIGEMVGQGESNEFQLLEAADPNSQTDRNLLNEDLQSIVNKLSEGKSSRERGIIRERLITDSGMTLGALGGRYKVSRETVRLVENKLRKKLIAKLKENGIER